MEELAGRTAVVTGGGGGIGRALGEAFVAAGMKVVLADVDGPVLEATVTELREQGAEVVGIETDVSDFASVEQLRDKAYAEFGAVHVLCNNAGVGAGAEGRMWEHTLNDWTWGLAVNVWGVIHGIKAFVPAMLAGGAEGHIVNTTSGNGGVAPMPSTPIYALTKGGVVSLTECLYAQLRMEQAPIGVSVLFPGPHMLRTGLFESWRHRPAALANATPRKTPPTTIDSFEQRMRDAGVDLVYTPVEEVASRVVDAVRADQFWILPPSQRTDDKIRARADSMLERANPTYLQDVTG
jgi:NAD(P)-dependent dehydrogenase (short-subunit alcohol dehydrogenase family)